MLEAEINKYQQTAPAKDHSTQGPPLTTRKLFWSFQWKLSKSFSLWPLSQAFPAPLSLHTDEYLRAALTQNRAVWKPL